MTEMFPILPLGPGHAVSIGLTSYDGGVFYGVNGDWDAVPDIAALAGLLEQSLAELVAASPAAVEPPVVEPPGVKAVGVKAVGVKAVGVEPPGVGAGRRIARRRPAAERAVARAPRGVRS